MNESVQTAIISTYLNEVFRQIQSSQATEHSYRPALKDLLNELDNSIEAINEPKQSEHGAPDFVIIGKKNKDLKLGYGEAKIPGENLDKIEKSEQMDRYKGYANLFLTDCLDWRFFRNGEKIFEIKIGELSREKTEISKLYSERYLILANELANFLSQTPENIRNGKRLAEIMGGKARRIRDNINDIIARQSDYEIDQIYGMMKELLVADLSPEKFADMYAQTLVYGLFVARYNDDTAHNFSRAEARDLVPATNPFLREFFDHITGSNFNKSLGYIVDELCEIFAASDIKEIVHKHLKITTDDEKDIKDPIIHFYEDFLANYDAKLRKQMGAYYTPIPVVRYIVRAVDRVLKEDFEIADGIASNEKVRYTTKTDPYRIGKSKDAKTYHEKTLDIPKVQILDPAVGTATFLNETIKYIYNQKFESQKGLWQSYANDNILPRLNGFELMMTPYTIAHLKLGMTLSELGATQLNQRLRVFLTNTLSEGVEKDLPLFALLGLTKVVAEESHLAAEVKNNLPVMVVMGNPPYSGVSSNETKFANELIKKYKVEPEGKVKLQERKHWLNDDYVKFIAFAEDMVAKNGKGVIAMITNNGYLDNPTFRGMRWHLAQTFDKIYITDLHGNAKKKEVAPDGSPDQNVFDIMQGVSIMIAVKTSDSKLPAQIFHSEIYGKRIDKFMGLNEDSPKFKKVKLDPKMYYFVPKNTEGKEEYERGIAINELMPVNTTGIVTMGDNFIVAEKPEIIAERIDNLSKNYYTEDVLNKNFNLGKNYAKYVLSNTKDLRLDRNKIVPLAYRPFDKRYTYFDNKVIWRWREKVMKNFLPADIHAQERERERERESSTGGSS